jgi:hypothetical protein
MNPAYYRTIFDFGFSINQTDFLYLKSLSDSKICTTQKNNYYLNQTEAKFLDHEYFFL